MDNERTPDRDERGLSDRRTAMQRMAVFGAFTAPVMMGLLHAEKAIAASGEGPGGPGPGESGGLEGGGLGG